MENAVLYIFVGKMSLLLTKYIICNFHLLLHNPLINVDMLYKRCQIILYKLLIQIINKTSLKM